MDDHPALAESYEGETHHNASTTVGEGDSHISNAPSPTVNGHEAYDGKGELPLEPIAIIGMGIRLPGGVHNASSYWDLLLNGRDGRCRVPKNRYNIDAWLGPGRPHHVASTHGYFLSDKKVDLAKMDASFWSMSREEAESMDPQQRLFLEVVYEALETAGATNWRGRDVGVYVGQMGDDWTIMESHDRLNLKPIRAEVFGDYIIANRTSYEFDFKGPSMAVRTACSSSMVALHIACQDIHSGTCSSAIVGGVNIIISPRDTNVMSEQGVLSPTGYCKTFDAEADGYARGEGVSAVCIKKLSDAVLDGDPIRAIIRSTCVSNDGKTLGMTVPSPECHEKTIRRAYQMAGINDLSKTAMVECHGTGTVVGDPLEVSAVANVWGDRGILIGSVKPNIGHGEGASGLSSIIKMVLALEHSTIPPNINFRTHNPAIPWEKAKLTVPTKPLPWPADRHERVSVNSFGIGGTNAHVILDSAASFGLDLETRHHAATNGFDAATSQARLLVFSAKHQAALHNSVEAIRDYVCNHPNRLKDLAYSLATRREAHHHRAFCVTGGDGTHDLKVTQQAKPCPADPLPLVWVFTGQGAQWAQMGKVLLEKEPLVFQRIEYFDQVLNDLSNPPPWTLKGEILKPKSTSRLYEAEFSQPCLAAIQIALVDLFQSWGLKPAAVVGHSSGETAAAYAVGAITARDAFLLAYHRGQITPAIKAAHSGGMAAVGLGRAQVERFLRPGVMIGCENSQAGVTLSGESDVLVEVMDDIRSAHPGVMVRALQVECGYHSHHMQVARGDYKSRLNGVDGIAIAKKPLLPFYSSVTGKLNRDLSGAHFVRNMASPVLFDSAIRTMSRDFPSAIYVELGPHPALGGPVRQILQSENKTATYIPTLVRNEDDLECVLSAAGQLWLAGADISLRAVTQSGRFLTDLPTYPWHYEEDLWMESRISREWRLREFAHHELLGTRVLETGDAAPAWRCKLRVEDVPWLRDHEIGGHIFFPGAAYASMVGEAVRQLAGSSEYTLQHVRFQAPLVLTEDAVEIVTALTPASGHAGWYDFSISTIKWNGDVWTKHATGRCRAGVVLESQLTPDTGPLPRKVNLIAFLDAWRRYGLNYGPRFRGLSDATSDVEHFRAVATLDTSAPPHDASFYHAIHPAVLDTSFHVCMLAANKGLERNFHRVMVPTYIEELQVRPPSAAGTVRVVAERARSYNGGEVSSMSGICGGEVVFHVRGLEVSRVHAKDAEIVEDDPHAASILEWKPDLDFVGSRRLESAGSASEEHPVSIFASLLGHKVPNLRVLEISRDGGDTTSKILRGLKTARGQRLYSQYLYYTPDGESLTAAKRAIGDVIGLQYAALELGPDSSIIGVEPSSFDLVVVSRYTDQPSATQSSRLDVVLAYARRLLRPQGRVLVRGILSNMSTQAMAWWEAFSQTGFYPPLGISAEDGIECAFAVAQPLVPTLDLADKCDNRKVSILCVNSSHPPIAAAASILKSRAFTPEFFILGQTLPPRNPVVSLLDLEFPFFHDMTAAEYVSIKRSILSLQEAIASSGGRLLWVTGASQVDCKDPRYSVALGAMRTIRRETSIDVVTLELECFSEAAWGAVADILDHLEHRHVGLDAADVDAETEYVFSEGAIKIGRLYPLNVMEELREESIEGSPKVLVVDQADSKKKLRWKQQVLKACSLADGFVEMDVKYVAATRQDVSISEGQTPGYNSEENRLGSYASGIIRKIGPDVRGFRSGDRVAFSCPGCFATTAAVPVSACVRVPDNVDLEQAASIPSAFGPAMYGILEVVKVERGQVCVNLLSNHEGVVSANNQPIFQQSILIHNACKPAGLAAIQVAMLQEARVFCTTATNEEAEFLASSVGVPRSNIFDSDNARFPQNILEATGDRGVNVLFGSLDGEVLDAASKCIAPFGFVLQTISSERASDNKGKGWMKPPPQNIAFVSLDFSQLLVYRPAVCSRLISQMFELFNSGTLSSKLLSINVFGANEIENAFKEMQKPDQRSSILVDMTDSVTNLKATLSRRKVTLLPDKTYIIVGGVGGLGLASARFLAERGACSLIFFSKSAAAFLEENPATQTELQAMGCDAQAISGSVEDMADVMRMLDSARHPVGGLLHAAMVLNDVGFPDMTFAQWRATVGPKVLGTWNLHRALLARQAEQPLDFFLLFSSLSGLGGQMGQANYAAANGFLDAFVQYRRSLGLACSVVDIGIMADIGILAKERHRMQAFRGLSLHLLRERELLDSLELMMVGRRRGAGTNSKEPSTVDDHDGREVGHHRAQLREFPPPGYISEGQIAIGLRSAAYRAGAGASMGNSGWERDPRTLIQRNVDAVSSLPPGRPAAAEANGDSRLRDLLHRLGSDPGFLRTREAAEALSWEVAAALSRFMMRAADDGAAAAVDRSASLRSLGVDSLVSVQLRTWFRQKVGVTLPVQEIRNAASIEGLAAVVAGRMRARTEG